LSVNRATDEFGPVVGLYELWRVGHPGFLTLAP
jgi:hypothetical protein